MEIAAPAVLVWKNVPVARGSHISRRWDGNFEQHWSVHVTNFAPIEARMRDHDFQSADKQCQEGKRDEPVRSSHEERVPQMRCLRHLRSSTNSAPVVQEISAKGHTRRLNVKY